MVPEEVELARVLIDIHPWAEKVRFARTGGESMAIAARIARATTGREKVAVCGYHGWHDWYIASNLDGEHQLDDHLLPELVPHGVPARLAKSIYPFAYNDVEQLERIFSENPDEIAAVSMEPMRYILPDPGYLEAVRELCTRHGAQLIFDEVFHRLEVHLRRGTPQAGRESRYGRLRQDNFQRASDGGNYRN